MTSTSNLQTFFSSTLQNEGFVKIEEFSKAFSLSVLSDIPAIFHGKGGYGKTEQIKACLSAIKDCTIGTLECDPETTASHIKGGAVARTKKNNKEDITEAFYNVQASVLQKHAFFFEEMLDSSFNALSVLKAIITNRELNLNGERVESQNKILVGATNLNPVLFKSSLPEVQENSYDAFLQRFLLVEHGWDSHSREDYALLDREFSYQEVSPISLSDILALRELVSKDISVGKDVCRILHHLAAKSSEGGSIVSPRSYKWTLKLLKAKALISERSTVSLDDLEVLQYLACWDLSLLSDLEEELERAQLVERLSASLAEFEEKLYTGFRKLDAASSQNKLTTAAKIWKAAKALEKDVMRNSYPDELCPKYEQVKALAAKLISRAEKDRDEAVEDGDAIL